MQSFPQIFQVYKDGVDIDQTQPLSQYTILAKLGKGLQSIVYRAVLNDAQLGFPQCSIKIYKPEFIATKDGKTIKNQKEMFANEVYAYTKLQEKARKQSSVSNFNCYITQLISYGCNGYLIKQKWRNMYFLILELHEGSLLDYINLQNRFIPLDFYKPIFIQMIRGLLLMHSTEQGCLHISHRDIKLENILTNDGYIKFVDFGLSTPGDQSVSGIRGSHLAPEIYDNKKSQNGQKIDIFATGYVLFQLIFRKIPFPHANRKKKTSYRLLASENISDKNEFWEKFDAIDDDLKDLFEKMFHPDPDERISLLQIVYHPWISAGFYDIIRLHQVGFITNSSYRSVEESKSSEQIQEAPQHPSLEQVTVVTAQKCYKYCSKDLQFPSYQETDFNLIKPQLADTALLFNNRDEENNLIQKCMMTEVKDDATQKIKNLKVVITQEEILENENDENNAREEEKQEEEEEEKKEEISQVSNINLVRENVVSEFLITVVKYEDIPNERFLKFQLVEGSELMLFNFMGKFVDLIQWE